MRKEIVFYYDVICPYAYLASKLVADVAKRNNAVLKWRPVLLGGIYKRTKKEDAVVPDNKMILTYAAQKRKILSQDLAMQFLRYKLPINRSSVPHEIKTLNALRLIIATDDDETSPLRIALTHKLFDALWLEKQDVSQMSVLQDIVDSLDYKIDVASVVKDKTHAARTKLMENTDEAIQRGAFGVPSFWLHNRLYFGGDRLFMVEQALGNKSAKPHRVIRQPQLNCKANLTVYFDFSSPWSYIGIKQLPQLLESLKPAQVNVEYVPILLGALFKDIGTPKVPMMHMGENKRNYYQQDFMDFLKYRGINNFTFSSHFPIRTILPCRVAIVKPEYKLIEAIYDSAWSMNKNIADEEVLKDVLEENGYNSNELLNGAATDHVKASLRNNTQRALDQGVCGVPSFQVNGGSVIFGQDRLNVVADQILGWKFDMPVNSKL